MAANNQTLSLTITGLQILNKIENDKIYQIIRNKCIRIILQDVFILRFKKNTHPMRKLIPFLFLFTSIIYACGPNETKTEDNNTISADTAKISVAEWSLHKNLQSGAINHLDFARIAADSFQIYHIEYVSQFFQDKASDTSYLNQMIDSCKKYKVKNIMIMVDGEGNLGDTIAEKSKQAVENHKKWVDAAAYLGCFSIRVNANGWGDLSKIKEAVVASLIELSDYAQKQNINILVENHGMLMPDNTWSMYAPSTNGAWLADVLKKVNKKNCFALPDFGNFDKYDKYQGMKDLMSFAYGISAKAFNFDENGEVVETDYEKIFTIANQFDFNGFIGIEYEGPDDNNLTEYQGVRKTKAIIQKHFNKGKARS